MISATIERLEARCHSWLARLGQPDGMEVVVSRATVGGGSLPGETLESRALAVPEALASRHGLTLDALARRLRTGESPVMPYVEAGRLLIDARTVLPDEDDAVVAALAAALGRGTT